MAKTKKAKTAASKSPKAERKPEFDLCSMQLWGSLVRSLLPDEEDERLIVEVATELRLQSQLLAENWTDINRVAKNDNKVALSWSFKADRSLEPPKVTVSGSFSEKHSMKAESDLPDPNQDELPGIVEEVQRSQEEQDKRMREDLADEEDDKPRVRTATEELAA